MKITAEHIEGKVLLRVSGKISVGQDLDGMKVAISKQLREGFRDFVIDMKKVTYLNSMGNGIIIHAAHMVRKSDGRIVFCNVNGRIANNWLITRLDLILPVYEDEAAALSSLAAKLDS